MIRQYACIAVTLAFAAPSTLAQTKIDLRTAEGVKQVKGEWRFQNAKIVEIDNPGPDQKPGKTYDVAPHAEKKDYDDSAWEVIDPTTLKNRRSTGRVCFCWYRIKVTLPPEVEGKTVQFVTTVDDYGEVWVDGALPRKPGDSGGPVVAGFNVPNRVELKDAKPGKVYSIAVFGINGPISASPTNYIFLGPTFLELTPKN
jgi:gluconolactonase